MPFIPEVRYINYLEIADITKHMRKDLKDGKLNALQSGIFNERPYEVLYDIENDIWETNNLAGNPKYKSIVDNMRQFMDAELLKAKDIMFMPEYEMAKITIKAIPIKPRIAKNFAHLAISFRKFFASLVSFNSCNSNMGSCLFITILYSKITKNYIFKKTKAIIG